MSSSGGRSNPQPAPFVPPTTAAPVFKKYDGIINNKTNQTFNIKTIHLLINNLMNSLFFDRPQLRSLDSGSFDKLRNSTTLHLQAKVTIFYN